MEELLSSPKSMAKALRAMQHKIKVHNKAFDLK